MHPNNIQGLIWKNEVFNFENDAIDEVILENLYAIIQLSMRILDVSLFSFCLS